MSIEDGDNIRFNNAIMDGEAAELRLAAAKLEYERQKLLLKQAEPTISPKAFEPICKSDRFRTVTFKPGEVQATLTNPAAINDATGHSAPEPDGYDGY